MLFFNALKYFGVNLRPAVIQLPTWALFVSVMSDQATNGFPRENRVGHPPERMVAAIHFVDVPPEYISRLKSSWTLLKKSESVKKMLHTFFQEAENPYALALEIASNCEDFFHSKANTLAAFVIEEFCSWAKFQEQNISHRLTPQLKFSAFCLITSQKNSALIKLVIDTFRMSEDKNLFVNKLRDFVRYKKYKEACQCAVALGLVHDFHIDDIILPLIFQDKLSVAEEALATDQGLQIELVGRLDEFLGERSLRNNIEHFVNQRDIPDVKLDRFINHKPLAKMIKKLTKTYNLSQETTPNLNQRSSAGALNFIFGKRFFDKSLSVDSWKEMAYDAVKNNPSLQMDLISMLNNFNEVEEALYWAIEFDIPQRQWPHNVLDLFKRDPLARHDFPRPSPANNQEPEDWNDDNNYHSLMIPDSSIIIVDSEELLKECVLYISNHQCKIVGIDSEWKPSFGGAQQNELALIQLATWDKIFILDVIGMAGISPDVWHEANRYFFENSAILKLGFNLSSDMTMIKSAIAPLANMKLSGTGYLDLSQVWRRLNARGLTFPFSGENASSSGESLSRLVSLCLGKSLDKKDQFSNWEQRPLRPGQKRYAALDAFCLLEVHNTLQQLSEQQGLPFLEMCDELTMGFRSPKKNLLPPGARRGRGRGRRPPGSSRNPGEGPSQGHGY